MESYRPKSNSWVCKDQMDADKLIKEFLAGHIDHVAECIQEMRYYIDKFNGKKVWYNDEDPALWELLGGHDDPSMDTKSPFKPDNIP